MNRLRQGTYSVVARDPLSGELGVAVQSHWFSVGPIVPWAVAGVGAVATQANVNVSYGPGLLDLLSQGVGAAEALARLIGEDPGAPGRQVAVVDGQGEVAVHTGASCIPFAGHVVGDGFACQANIMASDAVWPAMREAFQAGEGTLAQRLLHTLEAGERAGGDVRGRQSAALLVVPASGEEWESVVSLRVEDHGDPHAELRRLLVLHDAYALASEGDELVNQGRFAEAADLYERASDLAPDNHELLFWAGVGAVEAGDFDTGALRVQRAIAMHDGWRDLLGRLPPEVAPAAPELLRFISRQL